MKFQPGDPVLLLHSNEEGVVTEIISEKMVLVEVEGVRFPVYTDQIDFPYFKRFSEKKLIPPEKVKRYVDQIQKEGPSEKKSVNPGMWISFLPVFNKDIFEEDVVEKFKIYLLNQTSEALQFRYRIKYGGLPDFELTNSVASFADFYLHDIPFEELNDAPRFEFDFSQVVPLKGKATHFETSFKIRAKQLFVKMEGMKLKNEPTFSYLLFEDFPEQPPEPVSEYQRPSGNLYAVSEAKRKLEPARSVVDLHIEKLADDWKGLGNFEILTIQLSHFEKYYDLAVAHRQPHLIVIHGIGTGKLRDEIHELLKSKKEVRTFANQYHPNFGFGATEIFFQY
jgi:hypothetical protein